MDSQRRPCTAEDVEESVRAAVAVLAGLRDADWDGPAGEVTWSCRHVLSHVADDLVAYGAQLAVGAQDAYVPLESTVDENADPAAAVEALRAAAGLFTAVLRTAPPAATGWHPLGTADVEATAAMGVVELLVHTWDICTGLGHAWRGPDGPSEAALRRIFPDVTHLLDAHAPWDVLLWATGRTALPGQDRRTEWRWYNEPATSGADV